MTRMNRLFALAALVAAAGLSASCGGLFNINNRCDIRPRLPQCTDWRGTNAGSEVTERGVCAALGVAGGGTFGAGVTCDITDMWGGCQATFGDGSKQTNWYYKSDKYKTIEDAKANCDKDMTWVNPQ